MNKNKEQLKRKIVFCRATILVSVIITLTILPILFLAGLVDRNEALSILIVVPFIILTRLAQLQLQKTKKELHKKTV